MTNDEAIKKMGEQIRPPERPRGHRSYFIEGELCGEWRVHSYQSEDPAGRYIVLWFEKVAKLGLGPDEVVVNFQQFATKELAVARMAVVRLKGASVVLLEADKGHHKAVDFRHYIPDVARHTEYWGSVRDAQRDWVRERSEMGETWCFLKPRPKPIEPIHPAVSEAKAIVDHENHP